MTLHFDAVGDVPALIAARAALSPDQIACHCRASTGAWEYVTWRQYQDDIARVARGFIACGLRPGDRVAILAPPSYRWEVTEKAVVTAAGVVIGLDHLASKAQKVRCLAKLAPAVLVVGEASELAELDANALAGLKRIVVLDGAAIEGSLTWPQLLAAGATGRPLPAVSPEATATVVFTSGSSGEPKMVPYSQKQLVLAAKSILDAFGPADERDVTLCWLPLSNLFQRVMNLCAIGAGAQIFFAPDPRRVMEEIAEVRPSVFIGVPRFYEKVSERAEAAIAKLGPVRRGLVRRAMAAARASFIKRAEGEPLSTLERGRDALADRFVLRGLRQRLFGDRIRLLITGSAATPQPVKRFFTGVGLPLAEAYAMTENIVPMTVSRNLNRGQGCVGQPLPDNEIRIDETGEILVRGPGVFPGYLGDAESVQRFTEDGFFQTGDEGRFDEAGYLYLTGRKSDLIKTSTGRRIPPTPIEAALRAAALVQEAVVVGNGRKCLTAVLALDREAANGTPPAELLKQLSRHVQQTNQARASYERIAGCVVMHDGFSIGKGHLTTNLKPRRGRIEEALAHPLEQLYRAINENQPGEGGVRRVDDIAFAEAS